MAQVPGAAATGEDGGRRVRRVHVSSSSLRAHRCKIKAKVCPGSWSLSGLRVAEVSLWVTKFSSFCKAKQHCPPCQLLPQVPRGDLKGRCRERRYFGKQPSRACAEADNLARVGQCVCKYNPGPQNEPAASLELGPSPFWARWGGGEGGGGANANAPAIGLPARLRAEVRAAARLARPCQPEGAPAASHRRAASRGQGAGGEGRRGPAGWASAGRWKAACTEQEVHGARRSPAPRAAPGSPHVVACPAGGVSRPRRRGTGLELICAASRPPGSGSWPEPPATPPRPAGPPRSGGSRGLRRDAR